MWSLTCRMWIAMFTPHIHVLLVFIRQWRRLVMRNLINYYALLWLAGIQQLWLVHFDPCCSDGLFSQWGTFKVCWLWSALVHTSWRGDSHKTSPWQHHWIEIVDYTVNQVIRAFWLVLAYDLLEDRHQTD